MLCQRRLSGGPPLTVVTAILIFIIFVTKQAKDIYERNQKYHRMETYNEFISEVSSSMSTLEVSANRSRDALHELIGALREPNQRPAR